MAEIGETLREARMHARIDITEVESGTKIRARYLRALENEEWALLPGPVYIKSFLRTYADYLGLDSRMLVDEFKRQHELPSEHELRQSTGIRRERRSDAGSRPPREHLLPPWTVIGGVLVVVVVALYLIGSGGGGHSTPTVSHTAKHAREHHHKTTKTTPTRTTPIKPKTQLAKVKLVPTSDVWICAENQSGKQLINGVTYTAGETIPTLRGRAVLLDLGNANVTMTANGKPYTLSATTTAIGLKVTTKGVSTLTPGSGPTCAG